MAEPTTPGWYPDPYGSDEQRWFDGQNWAGRASDYEAPGTLQAREAGGRGAWDEIRNWGHSWNSREKIAAAVALVVVAGGLYWYAGRSSGPGTPSTSSVVGVIATGSFCKDLQAAATASGLTTNVSINGTETRAKALVKLEAFERTAQTWQAVGATLGPEAPVNVRAGLVATATFMGSLSSALTTTVAAVEALPVTASTQAVSNATGSLIGAVFAGALSMGESGGQAIKALPGALDAACGVGYAAKLGISTS